MLPLRVCTGSRLGRASRHRLWGQLAACRAGLGTRYKRCLMLLSICNQSLPVSDLLLGDICPSNGQFFAFAFSSPYSPPLPATFPFPSSSLPINQPCSALPSLDIPSLFWSVSITLASEQQKKKVKSGQDRTGDIPPRDNRARNIPRLRRLQGSDECAL